MSNEERMLPQADFELDELTVVILEEGSTRSAMGREDVQRLLNEHLRYTVGLVQAGKLLGAGALIDSGPDVRVTGLGFSRLEARQLSALIADDPAVRAGIEGFRVVSYRFPKGAISFAREQG